MSKNLFWQSSRKSLQFWSEFHTLVIVIKWGLEVFRLLKEYCKEEDLEVTDFWKNDRWLPPEHKNILAQVKKEINWRGTKKELLKRIRKQARMTEFSAREVKLITKLVNQQKKHGFRDFKAMVYYFPGKSVEMIEEKYKEGHPNTTCEV